MSILPPLIAILIALVLQGSIFCTLCRTSGWDHHPAFLCWKQYIYCHLPGGIFHCRHLPARSHVQSRASVHHHFLHADRSHGEPYHTKRRDEGCGEHTVEICQYAASGQFITWLMGVIIFFDDYANTLVVGNTMRPVTDRLKISREKLAYLVDSTAAPYCFHRLCHYLDRS